jgi:hypothetical protein
VTIQEPFRFDQAHPPQDAYTGQLADVEPNYSLYPALPLSQPVLKSCRASPGTMRQKGHLTSSQNHREQAIGQAQQANPYHNASSSHRRSTHRRESVKSLRSKATTHSASWTGDAEFFPNSGSPPLAVCTPQRALKYQFQATSIDPCMATNFQRPRANSRVQTWLEKLPPFPPAPDDMDEVSTPPLSPNVETERSCMRRWLRNWETKERQIDIDDDDVFGGLKAGRCPANAP